MIEQNLSDGVIVTNLNVTHTATGAHYVEYYIFGQSKNIRQFLL